MDPDMDLVDPSDLYSPLLDSDPDRASQAGCHSVLRVDSSGPVSHSFVFSYLFQQLAADVRGFLKVMSLET